jgi:type III secretion protein T
MAQSSGVLIDFARGASSLQVNDPTTQTQASDIGILYNYIMIVIFYEVNGIYLFFDAVMNSFTVIPADGWINPAFFTFKHYFWETVWHLMTKIFAISIQLAAPSLLAILMTELFLGIANRLAPQVQIAFLGMSLKSLAGLAMLTVAWFFIVKQLGVQMNLWLKDIPVLMQSMGS